MTDDRFDFKPEDVQAYMDQASKLRAEAIRGSFVDFRKAVNSLFGRVQHSMDIPRTEQL